ncbi:MAG: DUF2723 domain-containing protein [bacterium]|nr:DUF2723 domain-containing protein [bacterium]
MRKKLIKLLGYGLLLAPPLLVYLKTMPPSLTWKHFASDGGELIATVYTWGIPHPPGTPLYVFIGQIFRYLPINADPALKLGLMSTFFSLATLFIAFKTINLLINNRILSALAIYFLAFGVTFWAQAIVAEVLTLNVFLVALFTYYLLKWHLKPEKKKYLYLAALFFGLALTNHTSALAFIPSIVFLLGVTDYNYLFKPQRLIKIVGVVLLALTPYLYLYLRAQANPPLNWGDPSNLARFWEHITAKDYQQFLFFKNQHLVLDNFFRAGRLFWDNFNPLGFALIALGIFSTQSTEIKSFLIFAILFQIAVNSNYNIYNIETFYLPTLFFLDILLGLGLKEASQIVSVFSAKVRQHQKILFLKLSLPSFFRFPAKEAKLTVEQAFMTLLVMLTFAGGLANTIFRYKEVDLSKDREADDFGRQAFSVLEPNAIVITGTDRYTLGLLYHRYVIFPERKDVTLVPNGTFLQNYWQVQNLRRSHPELKYPEIKPENMPQKEEDAKKKLMEFIALNLPNHPIYLAETYPPLNVNFVTRSVFENKYTIESRGPIYRIVGEETN